MTLLMGFATEVHAASLISSVGLFYFLFLAVCILDVSSRSIMLLWRMGVIDICLVLIYSYQRKRIYLVRLLLASSSSSCNKRQFLALDPRDLELYSGPSMGARLTIITWLINPAMQQPVRLPK
jgi:hypothetical protein